MTAFHYDVTAHNATVKFAYLRYLGKMEATVSRSEACGFSRESLEAPCVRHTFKKKLVFAGNQLIHTCSLSGPFQYSVSLFCFLFFFLPGEGEGSAKLTGVEL